VGQAKFGIDLAAATLYSFKAKQSAKEADVEIRSRRAE